MPYDQNGIAAVSGQRPVNGQDTDAAQINVPLADIQSMLSQVLLKSGVAPMTGNLNMNGFRVSNLADANNDGDAVSKSYLDAETAAIETSVSESYRRIATRVSAYTALDADVNTIQRFTANATLSIAPWADLRANWLIEVWADGATVTIDPNLSETINGATSLVIQSGQRAMVFRSTTGTFIAYTAGDSFSGAQLQGYTFGLGLSRSAGDVSNDIDIQLGKAASDVSPYNLIISSVALTKQINAAWAAGTNVGGLDTGSVANSTYYIWLIQRPDTLATDVLFSLSSTAPTMPANYTRKRRIGQLTRASGVNGAPVQDGAAEELVKAWVVFNGSTGAISASANVSSVSRTGTGSYTVNFSVPMTDSNYSVSGSTATFAYVSVNSSSTGSCSVNTYRGNDNLIDSTRISLTFVR